MKCKVLTIDRIILSIMITLFSICTLMIGTDIKQRINLNYKYKYNLSKNHYIIDCDRIENPEFLLEFKQLCINERITLVFESEDILGIFDNNEIYDKYTLFMGSFFSYENQVNEDKVILIKIGASGIKINDYIKFNEDKYKVIGYYDENYEIFTSNEDIKYIYPFFSGNMIEGRYYISVKNEKFISSFNELIEKYNGKATIQKSKTSIFEYLGYLLTNYKFNLIVNVFLLSFVSIFITDFMTSKRRMQEFKVYYLVGTNKIKRFFKELYIMIGSCIFSSILAVVSYVFIVKRAIKSVGLLLPTNIIFVLLLLSSMLFVCVHLIIYSIDVKGVENL